MREDINRSLEPDTPKRRRRCNELPIADATLRLQRGNANRMAASAVPCSISRRGIMQQVDIKAGG